MQTVTIITKHWMNGDYFGHNDWNTWVTNVLNINRALNLTDPQYVVSTVFVTSNFWVGYATSLRDWFIKIKELLNITEVDYIDLPLPIANKPMWDVSVFNGIEHNFEIIKEIVENQ